MKRIIIFISIFAVFTSLLVGCSLNRFGTDKYYVHITVDGKEGVAKSIEGEVMGKEFTYNLVGFDENGKEKELEFKAQKNLRKQAFLLVYHSEEKGVKSWEEVQKEDLPAKVKEKFNVK
ncbi:YxeA family protein [Bacillus thuringiensis]|uniref:YxeA family protein n=1 Tax=Bacillus TaxID=1386 RepID=UPI001912E7FD|nr:YxeA family protein [Bacillus sp. TH13]MBK5493234.1 YxeA family protein [Bacillus sp. TH13]